MNKIFLVTGATGLIGQELVKTIIQRGDEVIAVTTNKDSAKKKLSTVKFFYSWNELTELKYGKIDVIINLAGMNLAEKRWNEHVKKKIYDSRIDSTRKLIELIVSMTNKPSVLINASGVDYYGDKENKDVYETEPPSNDFVAKLCVDWEQEAMKAESYGVRVVMMRTGFVMSKNSKAVAKLVLPFKLFVGGHLGSGKQFMSWIHIDDAVNGYLFAAGNPAIKGAVNLTSPNPVTMNDFCKSLAKTIHRPSLFPIPGFVVNLAAGEIAQVVLNGRKAFPKKLLDAGFKFKYEKVAEAWKSLFD